MEKERLLEFLMLAGKLKKTPRTGWKFSGVRNPESVADHSFRTAVMAYIFAKNLDADSDKALRMALFHDIPEALTGDIVTWNTLQMSKEKKSTLEEKALKEIETILGTENNDIISIIREFNDGRTREAKLVRAVDKMEAILQAYEYKKDPKEDRLNDYIDTFFDGETTEMVRGSDISSFLSYLEKRLDEDKK